MKRMSFPRYLQQALLLLCAATYLAACSSKPKQAVSIPADAQMVIVVNPKSIFQKVSFNEIAKLEAYQRMTRDMSESEQGKKMLSLANEILKKPEMTGIDPEKQIYVFVTDVNADQEYIGINFILGDESKFSGLVKDKLGMGSAIQKKDDNQYILKDEVVLMWNNSVGLLLVAEDMDARKGLVEKANSYLKYDKDEGLGGNEDFVDFSKEVKDLGMWTTVGNGAKQIPEKQLKDLGLSREDLSNNYLHTYVEFNNGEMIYNAEIKWSKGLRGAFKSMAGKEIGKDLLTYIPGDRMLGFFGFSINMKNLLANVREASKKSAEMGQGMALAEMGLTASGLSLDKIADNFTGQFFVAITDMTLEGDLVANKDKSLSDLRTKPEVVLAVGIKDSKEAQKLLEKVLEQARMPVAKEGSLYKINAGGSDVNEIFYTYISGYLLASNSKSIIEQASKGKLPSNRQVPGEVAKLAEGPLAGYLDFHSKAMPAKAKEDYTFGLVLSEVGLRSISLDNNGNFVRLSVRLADTKVNSLVSLLKLVDLPRKAAEKQDDVAREEMEPAEALN
ncbi:MAG: DUF4836 family protein [Bacteroidetes bacterium]|nr:DUF4836 family protein [Bacteroidota bacterium]